MNAMISERPKSLAEIATQEREFHLFAVGDIMLADAAQVYLDAHGYDYPFRKHLKRLDSGVQEFRKTEFWTT